MLPISVRFSEHSVRWEHQSRYQNPQLASPPRHSESLSTSVPSWFILAQNLDLSFFMLSHACITCSYPAPFSSHFPKGLRPLINPITVSSVVNAEEGERDRQGRRQMSYA